MPAATDDRRTIESFVYTTQRGGYGQNGKLPEHRPEVRATPRGIARLDWPSYSDDQIQGLAKMCSNEESDCAPAFKSDVNAEVDRRGLGPKGLSPQF